MMTMRAFVLFLVALATSAGCVMVPSQYYGPSRPHVIASPPVVHADPYYSPHSYDYAGPVVYPYGYYPGWYSYAGPVVYPYGYYPGWYSYGYTRPVVYHRGWGCCWGGVGRWSRYGHHRGRW